MEHKRSTPGSSLLLFSSRRLFICFASIIILSSVLLFFITTVQFFHIASSSSFSTSATRTIIRNTKSGIINKELEEYNTLRTKDQDSSWVQLLLSSFSNSNPSSSSSIHGDSLSTNINNKNKNPHTYTYLPSELEPIVLAYTACGNPNEIEEDLFGLVSLKSLLMARHQYSSSNKLRKYDIHILTNVEDLAEFWNSTHVNHDVYRLTRDDPNIRLFLHTIDELEAATVRVLTKLSSSSSNNDNNKLDKNLIPITIFKNCAAARLKLPFLLSELKIDKIIYMDWDTISLCDLSHLWNMFNNFYNHSSNTYAYMGFVPSDSSGTSALDHYREWNLPRHPVVGSINSGVMLLHVDNIVKNGLLDYWVTLSTIMTDYIPNITTADYWALTKAFPLGDQDVLNILFQRKPHWLYPVPAKYNYCLEIPLENHEMPCILHYCGNKLMPTERGVRMLPITHPWKASYLFIRYWPLIEPTTPPLFRGGAKEIVCKDKE